MTIQDHKIKFVYQYKYLRILLDDALSFKPHIHIYYILLYYYIYIHYIFFFFRIKAWLSFNAKIRPVAATFMSVLDYGDASIFAMLTCSG